MSLLWSSERKMKPLTNHKKPSPTHQHHLPDSARNPEMSKPDDRCRLSVISCFIKGTSLSASLFGKLSAGMTVEASLVLPLFLFFFLNMGSAIEMIRLHGNLQLALWQIGSKMSVYGYVLDSEEIPALGEEEQEGGWWKGMADIVFASAYVRTQLIDSAGRDYLEQSPLKYGADGLQLWESEIFGSGDEINIVVTYAVSPWNSLAGFFSFRMANRYYAHIWNGYGLPGEEGGCGTQMVFVTENTDVYHLDESCTHLRLSVRQVSAQELDSVKNQYGRPYQACVRCIKEDWGVFLYITEKGDCYHLVRECPGLKRTVYSISMKEAAGYRPCSRCGRETR